MKKFHTVLYNVVKGTFSLRENNSPRKVFSWSKNMHQ